MMILSFDSFKDHVCKKIEIDSDALPDKLRFEEYPAQWVDDGKWCDEEYVLLMGEARLQYWPERPMNQWHFHSPSRWLTAHQFQGDIVELTRSAIAKPLITTLGISLMLAGIPKTSK